jgi:hypothetical protein
MSRLGLSFAAIALGVAQATTGSIIGVVHDAVDKNAIAPGATVTVTAKGTTRTTHTDSSGRFRFSDVPEGTWRIVVRMPSFRAATGDLVVVAGRTTEWNAALQPYSRRPEIVPSMIDPTDSALARSLYSEVLGLIFRRDRPRQLLVEAESIVLPELSSEDWTDQLAQVPAELRTMLSNITQPTSFMHNPRAFPDGTRFAPRAEFEKFFEAPGDGWPSFPGRFGASSFQAFSHVLVTRDRLNALVEYRHQCGNVCAEGALAWFGRTRATDDWSLRGRGFMWVS